MAASLKAGWWDFNGTNAALDLPATRATAFDPSINDDDFTVMGEFAPGTITKANHALIGKWDETNNDRSWLVEIQDDDVVAQVSDDGTNTSSVTRASVLSVDTDVFFCMRYEYSGSGTVNDLYLDVDGTESSISNARGAIDSNDAPVKIGDLVSAADRFYDGKIYWLAYWNRKLTDTEVDNIRTGTTHPRHMNPDGYIDFHQAVGSDYDTEVPEAEDYWLFDVEGTPTAGGSSDPTLPVIIGLINSGPHPRDVYEGGSVIEAGMGALTLGPRGTGVRDGSQLRGLAIAAQPDPTTPTMFHRTTGQRAGSQRRGLASLLRFDRKRGK